MVLIPKHHARAVVDWLDAEVDRNFAYEVPDHERTDESRMNPYSVSVTAMIARWRGEHNLWHVTQSGRKGTIEVTCQDTNIETLIALRWSE